MFGSDEGRICLGCWGLCFGSDEGDTVDSVLVVVVFYCQGMSCLFLGMILLCFLIISFKTEHSTWYLSKGSMSFNIFHFLFSHSRLFWWRFSWLCFDLNVFRFASFFADFFMDFLDFVGGAQMRCARCFVCMEASLLRTYCVSWGTMYTLCTHCGITLHPEMLIAFSRSRQAHKCSQDKMSSTCGMCCTMNKSTHQEIVKCLSSSTVPVLEISAMGCRVASLPDVVVFGFSCQADETTVASQTTLQRRSRPRNSRLESGWLVVVARWPSWPLDGICGGIVKNKNGIVKNKNGIVKNKSEWRISLWMPLSKHASHVSRLNGR